MEPKKSFIDNLIGVVKKPFQPWTMTVENKVPQTVRIATTSSPVRGVAPLKPYSFDREDFRKRISWNESRGQKDPYQAVGPTKDLGRYQASPSTLQNWSEPWLGKRYDEKSFLSDRNAQDKFFDEYMNVAESYQLNPEEAAVMWHRGWGVLGTQEPKQVKAKKLREYLDKEMTSPASLNYLTTFRNYGQ